jgi:DNA-binding response OmpR family regulator
MASKRILIVDDEQVVRSLMKDFFSSFDYQVETASNGKEAIWKFSPGEFDCVISDCVMPEMNGLQLLESIRSRDKNVVFFLITGVPDEGWRQDSIHLGADDFIAKPFDICEVMGRMETAIQARRA